MKIRQQNYIQQLQLHNEEALIYIIDEYGALLKAVIRKHLFAMPHKQEECLNDVLLSIWEHAASFDETKNSFKNWIAAIARYQAIDYLRRYRRELEQVDIEDVVVVKEDKMLARLIDEEVSQEVKSLLGCLKPEDQKLFWKLYVEEEPIDFVSREMDMDKAVIYNRLSRGKKKIRRQFAKEREA